MLRKVEAVVGGILIPIGCAIVILPVLTYLAGSAIIKPVYKRIVYEPRLRKNKAIADRNASVYSPLNPRSHEIRLINILPSVRPSDDIKCETFHGAWDKSSYEALSYAWGSTTLRCRIKVDGQDFMITRNLHVALKRLRYHSTRRTLWIDAICINQADDRERNEQVKQMKNIYESATGVIVWLGEPPQTIERISGFFDPSAEIHFDYYDHPSTPLSLLLYNPWWDRMWVIQELLAARMVTVQFGKYTVSWPRFCQLVDNIEEGHSGPRKMIRLRNEWLSKKSPQYGLLRLAWDFRDKRASDDRDKLYGLLGLLPQEDHLITPQYADDADQVFKDFARAWINRYGSLLVINLARSGHWHPDWTDGPFKNKDERIESFWDEGFNDRESYALWHDKYSADGGHPAPNCTHPVNRDILHLRGFIRDTIIAVAVQCGQPSIGATPDWKAFMKEWRNFASKVTGLAHASINEAFHLTVTAGFFDSEPSGEQMAKYNEVRDATCRYRRFFVTSGGAFGIGPGEASEGDLVCVLLGARVPFILAKDRKYALDDEFEFVESPECSYLRRLMNSRIPESARASTKDPSYYLWNFIGDAYVHGIMNYGGDIRSDIASGKLVLQDFYLN